jgi:hypothetical protein
LSFDSGGNLWVESIKATILNRTLKVQFDEKNLSSCSSPIASITWPSSVLGDVSLPELARPQGEA